MKRSEMLQIIDDIIQDSRCFNFGEISTWQLDEKVLTAIEKAGMCPPERSYETTDAVIFSLSWDPE